MPKNTLPRRRRGKERARGAARTTEGQTLSRISALLREGQTAQANELCDAFLLLNPENAGALHLGGVMALNRGSVDIAVSRLRRAAMLEPRNASMLGDFGRALQLAGFRGDAEMAYRAALSLDPAHLEIMLNLGDLLAGAARDVEAADCYETILRHRPDIPEVSTRLSRTLLRLGRPLPAIAAARRALAVSPAMLEALQALAAALDVLGRGEEAVTTLRQAIAVQPLASLYHDLGMTQMHYGWLSDAEASLRQAIALEPQCGAWHRALAHLLTHRRRDSDIAAMEQLYRSNSAADDDRMHVSFGLGKALDELGAYDEAFSYFLEGNRLKRAHLDYASSETDRLFDTLKAAFTPERFAAHPEGGLPDPTPIFVLGMPRSCTSLVEQILASHPQVRGGGEFRFVNQLVGTIAGGAGFPIAAALDRLDDSQLRHIGKDYVDLVRGLSAEARFITDKLPGNFMMIGMIKLILPNARIIHCRRDPVDNCLSIFKNFFAGEHLRYAYDLAEIGHYYTRYLDLMAHWHRVLPGTVYDIDYETLVADFDGEARRLVAHCGLDWREECRSFFTAARSVQTASAVQVRQPIYTTSIGQAARYGDRLAPLLEALELSGAPERLTAGATRR